jgi:hypothetical protein
MREVRKSKPWSKPNVEGIDGETQNGRYVLLASSDRAPLYEPNGITANQFIDYLLEAPKGTIQVGYVTHYDVTKGLLSELNDTQRRILLDTEWLAYNRFDKDVTIRIHYIPHRTLEIWEYEQMDLEDFWAKKDERKLLRKARLYSIERFSGAGPFLETMSSFGYDFDAQFMESMKNLRGWSLWDEAPKEVLIDYNFTECSLIKQWANDILDFYSILGIKLTSYNGYGSAASKMLQRLHVRDHFQQEGIFSIADLSKLYIAGRSELFRNGDIKDVYYFDLKNAYVTAFSLIPSLAPSKVRWETVRYPSLEDLEYFGVSKVSWKPKETTNPIWGPLPLRDTNGAIYFPLEGSGLYHNLEVLEAIRRDNWEISVEWTKIAVPLAENDNRLWYDYPFASVRNMLDLRAEAKNLLKGKMSDEVKKGFEILSKQFPEYDFDLIIRSILSKPKQKINGRFIGETILDLYKGMGNSAYGKFAEKPHGRKGKEQLSKMNNLVFASFITSWCRSQILRHLDPDSIIMTATDSLISTKNIFEGKSFRDNDAEWDLKDYYPHGFFLVAGVYQLGDSLDKEHFKTRGVPAEDLKRVWDQFKAGTMNKISVDVPMLLGWKIFYRTSATWRKSYRQKFGQEFKADEWVPWTKTLSADANKKRSFDALNKAACKVMYGLSFDLSNVPSIPTFIDCLESQPERKYRLIDETLRVTKAQLEAIVQ